MRWVHEIAVSTEKRQPAPYVGDTFYASLPLGCVLQRLLILLLQDKRALLQIAGPLRDCPSYIGICYKIVVSLAN